MRQSLRICFAQGVLAVILVALAGCSPGGEHLPLPEQVGDATPTPLAPASPLHPGSTATPINLLAPPATPVKPAAATATPLEPATATPEPLSETVAITVDHYRLYESLKVPRFPDQTWKPADGYKFLFVDVFLDNTTPQEISVDVAVRGSYGNRELTSFPPWSFYDVPTMNGDGSVERFVIRSQGGPRKILMFEVPADADHAAVKLSFDLTYTSDTFSGHQTLEILLGTASARQ